MGRARKAAAPAESAQEPQDELDVGTDTSGCPGGTEDAVAGQIIGPADESALLGCQETSPLEEAPVLATYAVAGCERLRLRELPNVDARILAELPCGVGVLGEAGPAQEGWRWVATGRLEGWVMDEYLEMLGSGMALGDG